MRDYEELVKALRENAEWAEGNIWEVPIMLPDNLKQAADAIEELLKAAKAMHTWIYLYTGDEQAAYDECGLTDEMNAILGYGGQFVAEPPKEDDNG